MTFSVGFDNKGMKCIGVEAARFLRSTVLSSVLEIFQALSELLPVVMSNC